MAGLGWTVSMGSAAQWCRFGGVAIIALGWGLVATAASPDLRTERQAMLGDLLRTASASSVARDRSACLTGEKAKSIPKARTMGIQGIPDVADYCVTVLIRSARDGVRSLLRGATATVSTPASALDNGFFIAYGRGATMPAGLPTMATLKPIAERCLAMHEPNTRLCYATGYAFGQRAYHGETVTVR